MKTLILAYVLMASSLTAFAQESELKITHKENAEYTEAARAHGTEGTVILRMLFGANGKIKEIRVVRGLPDGLTESAIKAAKKTEFIPAKKDGNPVDTRANLEFVFKIK
jgi:protein TonB